MASHLTKAQRYEEAVKLDRAAMNLRNEMRRAHPRQHQVNLYLKRARSALDALGKKSRASRRTLSDSEKAQVRRLSQDTSQRDLANRFGVAPSTISRVVSA